MRENEDNIRHFMPVLRRIIILVAVLTAIPVALWTITSFVRTYVGPPKLPTFRTASVPTTTAPESTGTVAPTQDQQTAAAPQDASSGQRPVVVATATSGNDRGVLPPIKQQMSGPQPSDAAAPWPSGGQTFGGVAPNSAAPPPAAAAPPAPAAAPSDQQPAAADSAEAPATADAVPPGTPLTGPVPLPRKRPQMLAQVHGPLAGAIPLPRPRPAAADAASTDAPAQPSTWLTDRFDAH